MDEATYLRIIGDKTASLLSTCCEIGATSATHDNEQRRRLREFGERVGLAFQIRDDILDYTGRRSITGKPSGLDLSEKKLTLPLIHALKQSSRSDAREILSTIRDGGKKIKVQEVMDFVHKHGGIEYASARARAFAEEAVRLLEPFPDCASKHSLLGFASFVVDREK